MLFFWFCSFAELICVSLAGRFIGSVDTKTWHGPPEACGDPGRSAGVSLIVVAYSIPIIIALSSADDDREQALP